ncbi:2-C-methyl-D-erythritol 4-phosphate cytidylyltransferase/2-C-methyl-D-erythritol 2,4-cyclodiphosphate synthase [Sphingomonas jejuensis]|uniref:Bifunctional enzyme IspD/IspF n=1 Tax=Sphingomonas jejuensis TaxID=904715 RepID=A0ABX0XKV2_9SPHN|nr:2-C-methyl-D-erythritol 4-phosphate cytidylyltransferase/2-C-methyl-D-erythritol 2,4-cyclodiphosphate synthase [Sphingomonas jejuensis]
MTRPHRIAALVVAAGTGVRAGGDVPKQYRRIGGKAVIAYAVDAMTSHPAIQLVQPVIGPDQQELAAAALGNRDVMTPVAGGATRRDSVIAGLRAIAATGLADHVLIHDAARPFCPPSVIDRLIDALGEAPGAIPVLPVVDTLVALDGSEAPDRTTLGRVQTPQAFRLADIQAAHAAWSSDQTATDDATVLRAAGGAVALVEGDPRLEKLTTAGDLAAADRRLRMRTAVGTGFDVHRLEEGEELWLGGILIPHHQGLSGHSDADVGLHALTDAILGALGEGDIGLHFPPSDMRWRGARSDQFLQHAAAMVSAAGGRIEHLDLTLICEAPKIGPHRAAMRTAIAQMLSLSERRISIKATTTERLGFAGRGEGIAAQAAATLSLPDDLEDSA